MDCVGACPNNALMAGAEGIIIERARCSGCCACANACPAKAMAAVGTSWTAEGLVREVLKDKVYYDEFGGGVTVSGGEPLVYADFIAVFFSVLKANGVDTALDTCGYAPEDAIMKVLPFTDTLLYDIKLLDNELHMDLTGRGNAQILDNLSAAADYIRETRKGGRRGIKLWIRTPLIPGGTATEDNIGQIADYILDNIIDVTNRWELCSFNPACVVKYAKMQQPWLYEGIPIMRQSEIDRIKAYATGRGFPADKLIATGLAKP